LSTNAHPARRRWRLVLVPVAAVGLAGLVACGTGAAASTGSSGGAPDDSAMAAFASCMAENGVDATAWAAAQEACAQYAPTSPAS